MTQKKKRFSSPALTELTREQAIKPVAERKKYSEEEAAEFLQSLKTAKERWHGSKAETLSVEA